MAIALMLPKFIAYDTNGDPLAGGKVYVYVAGTTTPVTTYTDSTGSVANPHPVVLDSSGRADIWLLDGSYKVVLYDADDALVYSVDNIEITSTAAGSGDLTQLNYQKGTLLYAESNTGTDDYAITLPLGNIAAYSAGMIFRFKADVANTGTATLNVTNSNTSAALGITTITQLDGTTLNDGDIAAGSIVQVVYDGTNFQLQTSASGFTVEQIEDIVGGMVTGNTESGIAVTYDDPNGKLNFQTNSTTLSLTGDVTGNVTFDLASGTNSITTTVADDSHNHTDSTVSISSASVSDFTKAAQDAAGSLFTGNTETGIVSTYDDVNGKVNLTVDTTTLWLSGDVTGSTTLNLNNAINTINTTISTLSMGDTLSGIYVGYVQFDGTAVRLPSGWTSVKNSTGSYTVTHNLGTTNYVVILTGAAINTVATVETRTTIDFSYLTTVSGTGSDHSVMFAVFKY